VWGQIFTFIAAVLCLYFIFKYLSDQVKDVKFAASSAVVFWILMQIGAAIEIPYHQSILDMLHVTAVSFVLVALLMVTRHLRPFIFRYPYGLSYVPLLIPFTHLLVLDTYFIKDIIFLSTQGVAIAVYALLMLTNDIDTSSIISVLASTVLILSAYIMVWFLTDIYVIQNYYWQILLSAGMILGGYSFTRNIENNINPES